MLKGALFNTNSINCPRVRILAAKNNKEVRQCLNKSDIFQVTTPKSHTGESSLSPLSGTSTEVRGVGMCFCTLGKANLPTTIKEGWTGGARNQRPGRFFLTPGKIQ